MWVGYDCLLGCKLTATCKICFISIWSGVGLRNVPHTKDLTDVIRVIDHLKVHHSQENPPILDYWRVNLILTWWKSLSVLLSVGDSVIWWHSRQLGNLGLPSKCYANWMHRQMKAIFSGCLFVDQLTCDARWLLKSLIPVFANQTNVGGDWSQTIHSPHTSLFWGTASFVCVCVVDSNHNRSLVARSVCSISRS